MAPICTTANTAQIAGYAYVITTGDNTTSDGELLKTSGDGHLVMVNGTLIRIMLKKPFRDSELNELLYVIIVIVFYATALMTLIITQIKRQRREGTDVDYYDEYLQRNQEVKRTCQTATSLVRKGEKTAPSSTSQPLARSATVSGVSAERGGGWGGGNASLLEPPSRARDHSPRSAQRHSLNPKGVSRGGLGLGTMVPEEVGFLSSPNISPREISPMLESIPDIGT